MSDVQTCRVLDIFQDRSLHKQMNKQKKEVKEITDAKLDQMLNYVNFGNLKKNK